MNMKRVYQKKHKEHVITKEIGLGCGHWLLFNSPYPAVNERLYCTRCERNQTVTEKPRLPLP